MLEADANIRYEDNGRIWMLPFMYMMAAWVALKTFCNGADLPKAALLFDGLGLELRKIRQGAKTWVALHILYNHPFNKPTTFGEWLDNFWIGTASAQAVRNRLKLVRSKIRAAVLAGKTDEVRVVCLAAGSAEAVIQVAAELKAVGITVHCLLIDLEQSALDFAMQYAKERGVDTLQTAAYNIIRQTEQVQQLCSVFMPDIVEMVGLTDYLRTSTAIRLFKMIRKVLNHGGYFITANVIPNPEAYFLKHMLDWDMVYRSSDQLSQLLRSAGFDGILQVYKEPLGIHAIAIGQK